MQSLVTTLTREIIVKCFLILVQSLYIIILVTIRQLSFQRNEVQMQRLSKERVKFEEINLGYVDGTESVFANLAPDDDGTFSKWNCIVDGPPSTPYHGHSFEVALFVPPGYPYEPPRMRFVGKVFHPNVFAENDAYCGKICLIGEPSRWSPAMTLYSMLQSVQVLLSDPNTEDAANPQSALLHKNQRSNFDKTVKEWATAHSFRGCDVRELLRAGHSVQDSFQALYQSHQQGCDVTFALSCIQASNQRNDDTFWNSLCFLDHTNDNELKQNAKKNLQTQKMKQLHQQHTGRVLTEASRSMGESEVDKEYILGAEVLVGEKINRSCQFAARLLLVRGWKVKTVVHEWFEGCGESADDSRVDSCSCPHCTLISAANLQRPTWAYPNHYRGAEASNCDVCLSPLDASDQPLVEMECGHRAHRSCLGRRVGSWLAEARNCQRDVINASPDCAVNGCRFPVSISPPAMLWDRTFLNTEEVVENWKATVSGSVKPLEGGSLPTQVTVDSAVYELGKCKNGIYELPSVSGTAMWDHFCKLRKARARFLSESIAWKTCPRCKALVQLLETQTRDAVCSLCYERFCFDCDKGHHEPLPCSMARAWNGFLDHELLPGSGCRIRDLASDEGRQTAIEWVSKSTALELLLNLDRHARRAATWCAAGATAPTASELDDTVQGLCFAMTAISQRADPDPLAELWQRIGSSRAVLLASLNSIETELGALRADLSVPNVDWHGNIQDRGAGRINGVAAVALGNGRPVARRMDDFWPAVGGGIRHVYRPDDRRQNLFRDYRMQPSWLGREVKLMREMSQRLSAMIGDNDLQHRTAAAKGGLDSVCRQLEQLEQAALSIDDQIALASDQSRKLQLDRWRQFKDRAAKSLVTSLAELRKKLSALESVYWAALDLRNAAVRHQSEAGSGNTEGEISAPIQMFEAGISQQRAGLNEAVASFLGNLVPLMGHPVRQEHLARLHERLVALVENTNSTGLMDDDYDLQEGLEAVDWRAVALEVGVLEGEDLEILTKARMDDADRRALQHRRDEERSESLLSETTKECPGTLPGGTKCGVKCTLGEGCTMVGCVICESTWCWGCLTVQAYRGRPGESEREMVLAAEMQGRQCKCRPNQTLPGGPIRAVHGVQNVQPIQRVPLRHGRAAVGRGLPDGGCLGGLQEKIIAAERLRSCADLPAPEAAARLAELRTTLEIACRALGAATEPDPRSELMREIGVASAAAAGRALLKLRPQLIVNPVADTSEQSKKTIREYVQSAVETLLRPAPSQLRSQQATGSTSDEFPLATGSSGMEALMDAMVDGQWAPFARLGKRNYRESMEISRVDATERTKRQRVGVVREVNADVWRTRTASSAVGKDEVRKDSEGGGQQTASGGGETGVSESIRSLPPPETAEEALAGYEDALKLALDELANVDAAIALNELGVAGVLLWPSSAEAEVESARQDLESVVEEVKQTLWRAGIHVDSRWHIVCHIHELRTFTNSSEVMPSRDMIHLDHTS